MKYSHSRGFFSQEQRQVPTRGPMKQDCPLYHCQDPHLPCVAMTTTSTCPQGGSRVGSALLILHPMPGFQKILRSQEQVVELLPSLCGQDTKGQERLGNSRPMLVTSQACRAAQVPDTGLRALSPAEPRTQGLKAEPLLPFSLQMTRQTYRRAHTPLICRALKQK